MASGRQYYFLTIAETRNLTRASEQLMVSQPSLTQYLNKLESELEIKLIDRSHTPLRLTRGGQLYYEYLKAARALEEDFQRSLGELRRENETALTVGIPLQKSRDVLRKILPRLGLPQVPVSIWEGTSITVRERVLKGELSIGFCHMLAEQDGELTARCLKRERVLIVCHRDDPVLHGQTSSVDRTCRVSPEELSSQIFYQMGPEYILREAAAAQMERYGIEPRQRIMMSNLDAIIDLIQEGPDSGFAFMPDYTIYEHLAAGGCEKLAYLRLGEEDFSWPFCIIHKKGKPLPRPARDFWDRVVEICCADS